MKTKIVKHIFQFCEGYLQSIMMYALDVENAKKSALSMQLRWKITYPKIIPVNVICVFAAWNFVQLEQSGSILRISSMEGSAKIRMESEHDEYSKLCLFRRYNIN